MAFPIPGIGAVGGVTAPAATGYIDDLGPAAGVSPTGGSDFAKVLGGVIDGNQQLQATSNELAIAAVTGQIQDVHDATIASTRAQLSLELTAAIRNKAVDGFNEIMRMQA